jgi:hypothetical protein
LWALPLRTSPSQTYTIKFIARLGSEAADRQRLEADATWQQRVTECQSECVAARAELDHEKDRAAKYRAELCKAHVDTLDCRDVQHADVLAQREDTLQKAQLEAQHEIKLIEKRHFEEVTVLGEKLITVRTELNDVQNVGQELAAKVKADCERRIFELHQENNVLVHLSDKRTIDLAEWKEKCSRVQQERDEANSQNTTADREWRMKLTAAEEDLKSARDDNNSLQEGLAKLEQHHADAIHLSELFNYYCVLAQTRVPYLERFMHHLGPYIVYW